MDDVGGVDNESLQDHLDELVLLEQRADRRSQQLQATIDGYQTVNQKLVADVLGKIAGVEDSLDKLDSVSADIERSSERMARQAMQAAYLFLFSTVAGLVIVLGAWWWSDHLLGNLSQARAELASLRVTLAHKPVIQLVDGQPFVRVIPHSQTRLGRGENQSLPGVYAKLWHYK